MGIYSVNSLTKRHYPGRGGRSGETYLRRSTPEGMRIVALGDSSNTHEVVSELFRAMNTKTAERKQASIRSWANVFPYVNGGLFSGSVDVPRFSKIARSYLLHVGSLDWTKINPDIFGSMIQAVADDEERGALGMHYTSVPNILKVLNPLFLDDLRARLEETGDNVRKLLNLRQRIAHMGEPFRSDYGRPDRRLRVVYDNGTESDPLVRSLQRALNKDKGSRRITDPNFGPLFSDEEEEDDLPAGYIYVLRSKSENPFIAENRTVIHKIGVTGSDVKSRIANAKKDPTYLLADVDIVATFKLSNINRTRLEALLHRFFAGARLDLELKDRFGGQVEPREWFLVPLPVLEEAIQKLKDGTIGNFRYDPKAARLVEV